MLLLRLMKRLKSKRLRKEMQVIKRNKLPKRRREKNSQLKLDLEKELVLS